MQTSREFLDTLLENLNAKDKIHAKKIESNIQFATANYPGEFNDVLSLIHHFFLKTGQHPKDISHDYLKMVNDMRREGKFFTKNGTYSCKSQKEADIAVYSNPDVMSYYMNALVASQILWRHHFETFMYFKNNLKNFFSTQSKLRILDVGPGHGLFSFIVRGEFPECEKINIVDISDTSLRLTKMMIGTGNGKINYHKKNIFDYESTEKYDLIILGEVIEHLDEPKPILYKLSQLLKKDGILWVTAPTNAPALDHVYLFKTKQEIVDLIQDTGLEIKSSCNFYAEELPESLALKFKVTNLVGLFCGN